MPGDVAFYGIVDRLRAFLAPVLRALAAGERPPKSWLPGGPWA